MTDLSPTADCPAELLASAVQTMGRDDTEGLTALDKLLVIYPGDARLHFLRGSLLASLQRYDEARGAIGVAVTLAPGFLIARFQLGFLAFTSGDYPAAELAWAPLDTLPTDSALRTFSKGLRALAQDDFRQAIELLRVGITQNQDNPPLNGDMQLIIDQAEQIIVTPPSDDEPLSAAQQLLKQYQGSRTSH